MYPSTFYDLVATNLDSRGDHPALVERARHVTYAELAREVDAVAAWLTAVGVRRGDRIGVHLYKSVEEVVAMFATARIGAVFVNINHQWTLNQLDYVLRDCRAKALFVDERAGRRLAAAQLPETLEHVVVKGRDPEHPRMIAWKDIPPPTNPPSLDGSAADLAAIIYTSGSTGQPKGVMLSNRNLVQGARSVTRYLENVAEDRVLSLLPFSFDYGLNQLTTMCLVGGTLVLHPVMMPVEIVHALREQRITGFAAVPTAWIPIVRLLAEHPTELPELRYVTNSGGKIPDSVLALMPQVFTTAKIYLMYGLTEAFRSTYLPPELFGTKMGSIGKAIPGEETYIIDPQIGICSPGQQGELVHRGGLVSMGYWGNPEATAEKIKPCPQLESLIGDEKVVYSGDVIRIDADGYYWFVGRRDEMIKSSDFRISPTEVEEAILRTGMVSDVIAFGVPDESVGQAVEIVITTVGDAEVDEAGLRRQCVHTMPSYMVPRRIHHWSGSFPQTASGKSARAEVIRRYVVSQLEPILTKPRAKVPSRKGKAQR